ncbi:histone deacetylase 6 isoform X2 [Schistocerca cancellata]|uniref:histone deacetylase 6 isoform X2 n=1 Tax=Schistocerca cancellata TaxID=274614 RepID=UPI0021181D80|nr:histone deacetylase 6 isoform X2 [Schistocerca cancellata]
MKRSNKKSSKPLERVKPSQAIVAAKRNAKLKQTSKKQAEIIIKDIYESARECKEMIRGSTGVIFDRRMVEHHCLWDSNYPESPERFSRVLHRCEELGLISRCTVITPRTAEEYEVLYKHEERHIEILKATENCKDEESLEKLSSKYDAIYIHPSTYQLSLLAAGCAIEIVDAVCRKKIQNGMAIVRPPGHHAMKSEYCGYCFFNNVALAAEHALNNCDISRIVIVDWDVHHGQATQQMFYDDPRVVYFSIHRYEHGSFWPNLRESDYDYIGEGKGKGYNFNVPLNKTGMTDADYLAIFHHVLLPVVLEFQPELLIVSAGYDSALGDEKGEMNITPVCYAHLLSSLMCLASGKIVVVLEGGYCLKSLAEGAALTLRCLLGDPCPPLPSLPAPSDSITESILNVIYAHRDYWKSLQIQDVHKKLTEAETNPNNRIREEKMTSAVVKLYQIPPTLFLGSSEKPEHYETRNCYPVQSEALLKELDATLNKLIVGTNLSFAPNRVCIVYDEVMMKHKNIAEPTHPEKPERISAIFLKHEEYGLLDRCLRLKARPVTDEELELLHSRDHIKKMKDIKNMKLNDILKMQDDFSSMYLHPETYESAAVAAGSVLEVVDSVLNGDSRSGVAIVRPPGHHAEEGEPCGFCVFNNVALAAKYAVKIHGLKRVLILDWDVHHGNGTQHMFEEDPSVLYISLHRYDNGSFFPGSTDANYTEVGVGPGKGYNINIPWNKRGMGDGDYVTAFHQVVLPVCYQFNPELVLVSAGFDAAIGDPLGGCKVTPEAYGHMAHWLSSLANGKIILCLEGGYNITSISYAMTLCSKALLGDPLPPLQAKLAPSQSAINTIRNVVKVQSNYWSCLRFGVSFLDQQYLTDHMKAVGDTDVVSSCSQCKEEMSAQIPNASSISLEDTFARINLREEVALHYSKSASSHITTKDNYLNDSNYFSSSGEDKSPDSPMDFSGTSSLISPISSPGDCNPSWSLSPPVSVTIPENVCNETVVNTQFSDKIEAELELDEKNRNVARKNSELSLLSDLGHDSNENPITEKHPKGIGDTEVSLRRMADNNTSSSGSNSQQAGASNSADGGDAADSSAASGSSSRPRRLVDYLAENMQMLVAGEMFAVVPLPGCPHLDRVREVPPCGINCTLPCLECGSTRENWICLECYTVHCGRYVNGHMVEHGMEMSHPITLSFSDISVWCYACEAYIENQVLYSAKNAVHRSKFGTEMPWSYND